MKQIVLLVFYSFSVFGNCASGDKQGNANSPGITSNKNSDTAGSNMKIIIGKRTFAATLLDNSTTAAFKSLLPMTVNMVELNGNEKYADLSQSLPAGASNPRTIQTGDLMLYGPSTLVLFYKTFSTSYSYTRLGRVNDVSGLAAALGSGNVTITIELD